MTFLFAFIFGIYVGHPHYHSVGPERGPLMGVSTKGAPIGIPARPM